MKLLFDQNLSSALASRLSTLYPGSTHVKTLGMMTSPDVEIWQYAWENGFAIVSKDADFQQRSLLLGAPPKVVRLAVGNSPTARVEQLLRDRAEEVRDFDADPKLSLLVLS